MNLIWSVERKPGGNKEAIQFSYKPESNIIIEVEFFSSFFFFAKNLKMEKKTQGLWQNNTQKKAKAAQKHQQKHN